MGERKAHSKALTHVDAHGRPIMVDVSDKTETAREALAESFVWLPSVIRDQLRDGELDTTKGPVFATATIAGVMAAKRTHELIPFCHPLGLTGCDIDIVPEGEGVRIRCRCRVRRKIFPGFWRWVVI